MQTTWDTTSPPQYKSKKERILRWYLKNTVFWGSSTLTEVHIDISFKSTRIDKQKPRAHCFTFTSTFSSKPSFTNCLVKKKENMTNALSHCAVNYHSMSLKKKKKKKKKPFMVTTDQNHHNEDMKAAADQLVFTISHNSLVVWSILCHWLDE